MMRGRGCPEQIARKARPDLYPADDAPREPVPEGSFPLGLVRDAVLVLFTSLVAARTPDGEVPVHEAVALAVEQSWQEWSPDVVPAVEAGVVGYLEVLASLRASGDLPPTKVVSDVVAVQDPDGDRVEFWAWAVHHVGLDGARREVHLLRWGGVESATLTDAEVALIAHVAGSGFLAEHGKWYQRFVPIAGLTQPPPARDVRVRLIGVLDGTSQECFAGTPQQATAAFELAMPSAVGVLAGGRTRPTRACSGCNVRHVCPGLATYPGLLGVAGFAPTTRSVSPSDLWTHGACPRQLHLARDLGLPRERGEASEALRRGIQVHAWLAVAHERGIACTESDLPDDLDAAPDALRSLGWSAPEYSVNRPYLLQHLRGCPLREDGVRVLSEVEVTAWDDDANVVLSTRPDTAYLGSSGAWVIRETKTLSPRGLPDDPTALLRRYPQVAAAVCLLADGYRPDDQPLERPGVVELELLGPDAAQVLSFDASDPLTVLVARTALAERVDAWLFDTEHPIGEHPPCGTCEVARWCGRQPEASVTLTVADLLGPDTGSGEGQVQAPDAVLRDLVGVLDEEEEFPF
jgi:hypothetical protein